MDIAKYREEQRIRGLVQHLEQELSRTRVAIGKANDEVSRLEFDAKCVEEKLKMWNKKLEEGTYGWVK